MPIRLGLCCINTELREQKPPIFCSRTCTRKTFTLEKAKNLAIQNVRDISKMIEWNEVNNIRCFRLSSNLFPHFTDETVPLYNILFAKEELARAGELANRLNHRILMHPGQYNQIGAISDDVFTKTSEDLTHHANILDAMSISDDGVLIVHGGGIYNDKEKTQQRWIEQFDELPKKVRRRLVIENCEKSWSTEDVLEISRATDIPVVFDFHHYHCYSKLHPTVKQKSITDLIPEVLETWSARIPVMHISEQGNGRIGHHSDYIDELPPELLEIVKKFPNKVLDVEVEAKKKEQAIFRLYDKYSSHSGIIFG